MILLTRNEAGNVTHAVRSLLEQDVTDLEVIVIDSASTDSTVNEARALANEDDRVRVIASPVDITIGDARNRGLAEARADAVAFVSADAWVAPGWAREALAALEDADVVYGRQEHAPPALNVAAVVRGLRYHHFDKDDALPAEAFASNVNAAIRRKVFDRVAYVDDGPGSALDDILFTREATTLGHRVAYRRGMLVYHKDASTLAMEYEKNRREGYGWGILSPRLGVHATVLAWAAALPALGVAVALWPTALTAGALALGVWAPTLRRIANAGRKYVAKAPLALAGATLVGPAFDLAFMVNYVKGLRERRSDLTGLKDHAQGA